jgi:hypothetical protein
LEAGPPPQPPATNEPDGTQGNFSAWWAGRWVSMRVAVGQASNQEKVRAALALLLVGVLIALQFFPSGQSEWTTATETLAISVVAFYFGLHGATSTRQQQQQTTAPPQDADG